MWRDKVLVCCFACALFSVVCYRKLLLSMSVLLGYSGDFTVVGGMTNISSCSSHNFFKFFFIFVPELLHPVVWLFLCVSTSAGEVMNFFSDNMSQQGFFIFHALTLQHGFFIFVFIYVQKPLPSAVWPFYKCQFLQGRLWTPFFDMSQWGFFNFYALTLQHGFSSNFFYWKFYDSSEFQHSVVWPFHKCPTLTGGKLWMFSLNSSPQFNFSGLHVFTL